MNKHHVTPASFYTLKFYAAQIQEVFCDMVGLAMFKTSYLHAFKYFLAPGIKGRRSEFYLSMLDRIKAMETACQELNITFPRNYSDSFENEPMNFGELTNFLIKISDECTNSLVKELIKDVKSLILDSKLIEYSDSKTKMIEKSFSYLVPATDTDGLANILNAGWNSFYSGFSSLHSSQKGMIKHEEDYLEILNELILKTVEYFEIEQRLNSNPVRHVDQLVLGIV